MPWGLAHVDEQAVVAQLAAAEFSGLEELPKDEWPAR
jgi:hypothetical protein